jgi:hypothetical protein
MLTEATAGGPTVKAVEALTDSSDAPIVVLPSASADASPDTLIVETLGADEVQVTVLVKSCVAPLLKVPVAVNGCAKPSGVEGFAGLMVMETRLGATTVTDVEPHTAPAQALTDALPGETP